MFPYAQVPVAGAYSVSRAPLRYDHTDAGTAGTFAVPVRAVGLRLRLRRSCLVPDRCHHVRAGGASLARSRTVVPNVATVRECTAGAAAASCCVHAANSTDASRGHPGHCRERERHFGPAGLRFHQRVVAGRHQHHGACLRLSMAVIGGLLMLMLLLLWWW